MIPRLALFATLGAACFAAVYAALPPGAESPPETFDYPSSEAMPNPAQVATTAEPPSPQSPPREIVDRAVRDVTPAGVTPGPKVTGPLVKVAPPPKAEKPKPAEPPPQARWERLFRPVVVAAGTIEAGSVRLRLAGIAAPDVEAQCGAANWPCGRMARTALRRFIRGRAIECAVPPGAAEIPDRASCEVGGRDIAGWLVEQGWAEADGDLYRAGEDRARSARLGLWSDGRPGVLQAAAPARSPDSARAISARVSGTP